jgi:hypothetical protein
MDKNTQRALEEVRQFAPSLNWGEAIQVYAILRADQRHGMLSCLRCCLTKTIKLGQKYCCNREDHQVDGFLLRLPHHRYHRCGVCEVQ